MKTAAETLGMTEKQVSDMAKNVQELESLDSAMADLQDAKNGMTGDGLNQLGDALDGMASLGSRMNNGNGASGRGRGQGDRPEAPDQTAEDKTSGRQKIG